MKPQEMKVLVVADGVWGKGDTIEEALGKCPGKPSQYAVYVCHPETTVDSFGYFCYPAGDNIDRTGGENGPKKIGTFKKRTLVKERKGSEA